MSWRSERVLYGLDPPGSTRRGPHERWSGAAMILADVAVACVWLDVCVLPLALVILDDVFGVVVPTDWVRVIALALLAPLLPIVPMMGLGDRLDRRARERDPELARAVRGDPAP